MTLDDIARQLEEMQRDMSAVRSDLKSLRGDVATRTDLTTLRDEQGTIRGDLTSLTKIVDEGFSASRARDEELRDLMKFGLEAREALRETVGLRFDQTDRKFDEQIGLLKDVIRHNVSNR